MPLRSTRTPEQRRLLALGMGTAAALLLFWIFRVAWWQPRQHFEGVVVLGDASSLDVLLRERERALADGEVDPLEPGQREPLSLEVAEVLFPQLVSARAGIVHDPHTYYHYRGGLSHLVREVGYHPAGEFRIRTNSIGLREDEELAASKPDLRILIAGDSHTEGFCDNRDSFPNVLEALLEEALPDSSIEVLNAGQSGFSFYNYIGTLERFLERGLDVFVMAVYGGNDFAECLVLRNYFEGTQRPACQQCDLQALLQTHPETPGIVLQAYYQSLFFRHHPEQVEQALATATILTAEVQRICRDNGVRLVCLYIPPMVDIQPRFFAGVRSVRETHGIELTQLRGADPLAKTWITRVRELGINCVDLRETFSGVDEPLYWWRDHHLNLHANRLVAETLEPLFTE